MKRKSRKSLAKVVKTVSTTRWNSSPGRTRHNSHEPHGSAEARRAGNRTETQRNMTSRSRNMPKTSANRNGQTKAALRCYEYEGFWHFARECPTRLNREGSSTDPPGKGSPREPTRRSQPPDQSSQGTNGECRKKTTIPGNEFEVWLKTALCTSATQKTLSVIIRFPFRWNTARPLSVEIEVMWRSLILDTGSTISILQPGVSRSDVHVTAVEP